MKKGKKFSLIKNDNTNFYNCKYSNKKSIKIEFYECPKCKTVMRKEEEKDHILAHELEEKIQNNIKMDLNLMTQRRVN